MKENFPIFTNNPDLVFLDSAASAQKPQCVIDAMVKCMETSYANIHRGLYTLSQKTTTDYENARTKVAKFINAEPNEIVFTRNATESINLVAQTWGKANLKAGDEIIISILEHHANIVPWQMLEKEIGIKIKVIPLTNPSLAEGSKKPREAEADLGAGKMKRSNRLKEYSRELRNNATKEERQLWKHISKKQTGFVFRRQYVIDDKYIADFICPEKRLIIEIDGEQHSNNEKDKTRTAYLNKQGFKVIRFWNNEINQNFKSCYDALVYALNEEPLPRPQNCNTVLTPPPVRGDFELDFDVFKSLITDKTKLLALTGMSNSLGTTIDTKKFIKEAKKGSITTLIDGCQSIVHAKQDMKDLDCDFFVFSGHKLYGPTGIGVLYGKYELLEKMPPYQTGGDMIKKVSIENGTTFNTPPARFEAGTPAIVEAIGLGAAIDFIEKNAPLPDPLPQGEREEVYLTKKCLDILNNIDGINIIGKNQCGIISFTTDWGSPEDIATLLSQQHVAVRVGHHCAMPLMDSLGISGTIRVSFGIYNDENDVEKLKQALIKCKEMLD